MVSTTRRFASAEYFATYGGKNKDNPNPMVRTAAFHEEVLIYGDVPQEAIIGYVGEE